MFRTDFETYLNEENVAGSGKASSYLKALDWLRQMLEIESYGFSDCINIWSVQSVARLSDLRALVLLEQKNSSSPWYAGGIPVSYLRDGYCAAALSDLIRFVPQQVFVDKLLKIYDSHVDDEAGLATQLDIDPELPDDYVYDPKSKDGQDLIREAKIRIGQAAFRKMILKNYQNSCCITGLDIPILNRASHIIGWAERKETRMLPSNGLCLSATYDAAFDKKLISLDEKYRVIISKEIRDHYSNNHVKVYFECREGQVITYPVRSKPSQEFLETHRKAGNF
jgi:putative restriction endonuclease